MTTGVGVHCVDTCPAERYGPIVRAPREFLLLTLAFALPACDVEHAPPAETACADTELADDAGVCVPIACGAAVPHGDVEIGPEETIQSAADALGAGTLVLSAGTWNETLTLGPEHDGLTIVGRCPALTTIDGADGGNDTKTVDIDARGQQVYTLRNLTVSGGQAGGVDMRAVDVTVSHVRFADNRTFGVGMHSSGALTMDDVTVERTGVSAAGNLGNGMEFSSSARVTGTNIEISENHSIGLYVGLATVEMTNLNVRDTQAVESGSFGYGVDVEGGGELTVTGGDISANRVLGILVAGRSTATLTDVTIRDTVMDDHKIGGYGLQVSEDSTLDGTGVWSIGNTALGIIADGATLSLRDSHIVGTLSPERGVSAVGLSAQGGATVTMAESTISGTEGDGVLGGDPGTSLALDHVDVTGGTRGAEVVQGAVLSATDVTFRGSSDSGLIVDGASSAVTLTRATIGDTGGGVRGAGVSVQGGATGMFADVVLTGSHFVAVSVVDAGSTLNGQHIEILGTLPDVDGNGGSGILVGEGAYGEFDDVLIRGATSGGVGASTGGYARLNDCIIDHVRQDAIGLAPNGANGMGAIAQSGGQLRFDRCAISDVQTAGVVATGAGSAAVLNDVSISGLVPDDEVDNAQGVAVVGGARLDAVRVTIHGARGGGVIAIGEGTVARFAKVDISGGEPTFTGAGGGIEVGDYADVEIADASVATQRGHGLMADGHATVRVHRLRVHDLSPPSVYGDVIGIAAQNAAVIDLHDVQLSDVVGPALSVSINASLSCDACSIERAAFAGAVAVGGSMQLSNSTIRDVRRDVSYGGGTGVFALYSPDGPTWLTVTNSAISGNALAAAWLDGDVSAQILDSTLDGGEGFALRDDLSIHGNALFARDTKHDALRFAGTTFGASAVGVLLDGASADFSGAMWSANALDFVQQRCAGVAEATGLATDSTVTCPEGELPTLDLYYDPYLIEPTALGE